MASLLNLLPWKRRRLERELARELSHHIERRAEDLVHSGVDVAEARRRAAIEFGSVTQVQEEVRDAWFWRWLDDLGRDVRYGVRMLRRSPIFTAAAVLSLAIGIGANAAIFSLVDRILLRALTVPEPGQLVRLAWEGSDFTGKWGSGTLVSYPLCRELDGQEQVFDGVLCRHPTMVVLSIGRDREQVRAEIVSGSYFQVLGAHPELGRLITPADDAQPGTHPVVVLSHAFWRDRLGGAADVLGRTIRLNNYPMTVIGVTSADFRGVDPHTRPVVYVPAAMTEQAASLEPYWQGLLDRRTAWMHAIGRLRPDQSIESARRDLQPWFRSMLEADPRSEGFPVVSADQLRAFFASRLELTPAPLGVSTLRGSLEQPLSLLMGGTVLLLALASLNVAGLLLARGAARHRELRTRLALGGTRRRLMRQLLVESTLITVCGAMLGLALAPPVARGLLALLARDGDIPVGIDARIFAFALLVSVATAVLCSLAPIVHASRLPLMAALNERAAVGGRARGRQALVVAQLAVTMVLLVGAGLFVETLTRLRARGDEFTARHVVLFKANPPALGYPEAQAERVMHELLRRLQDVPGVQRVAVANTDLLGGFGASNYVTIDRGERVVTDRAVSRLRVGPGFFATLGATVIDGREFDASDVRAAGEPPRARRTAMVNESFARRYFGTASPVGHRVGMGNGPDVETTIEIIGVVKDFSTRNLRDLAIEQIYLSFFDTDSGDGTFYLSLHEKSDAVLAAIRDAVAAVDPALPISPMTIEQQIERSLRMERLLATLSGSFGAIALLLSVVGLYGVMSFLVTQRTPEIGVRLALGATPAAAVWLVTRDAVVMLALGMSVAIPATWALGRVVEAQLFGVSAFDGRMILLASGVLSMVALTAAMFPGLRAATVSPVQALRAE